MVISGVLGHFVRPSRHHSAGTAKLRIAENYTLNYISCATSSRQARWAAYG